MYRLWLKFRRYLQKMRAVKLDRQANYYAGMYTFAHGEAETSWLEVRALQKEIDDTHN